MSRNRNASLQHTTTMTREGESMTNKERRRIRRDWLYNLRSGLFKQRKDRLCFEGRYCCLGVLQWQESVPEDDTLHGHLDYDYWNSLRTGMSQTMLASMNDEGRSFNEIADCIEANWKIDE